MKITTVLFDLDGTLLPMDQNVFIKAYFGGLARHLAPHGYEAQKLIEERGGVCQSSVTAKTTLVIAGEEAGSKLDKAKKLGIKVIDENTFKSMLEE